MRHTALFIFAVFGLVLVWFLYALVQDSPKNPLADLESATFSFDDTVPKEALLGDVARLAELIRDVHAGPFRVITENEFSAAVDSLAARIRREDPDSMGVADCYYRLQELAAAVRDGHTYVLPLRWMERFDAVFPLDVTVVDGRVFVDRSPDDSGVPERAELVAVNGIGVSRMMAETMKFTEGTLPHFRAAKWAEKFRLYLHTFYRLEPPWEIEFLAGGERRKTVIEAESTASYRDRSAAERAYREASFRAGGETVPVMALPSLDYGGLERFERFVADFFRRHRDAPHIVVDIRRCPGGYALWGFLVLDRFASSRYRIAVRFAPRASAEYKTLICYTVRIDYHGKMIPNVFWDLPLYRLFSYDPKYVAVLNAETGVFIDVPELFHTPGGDIEPYSGEVYLLTSHATFSAGVVMASAFMSHGMGTVVGRETGGRIDFHSDPIAVELPGPRLPVFIPTAVLTLPGPVPDRGVEPDVAVPLTAEVFIAGRDPDIARVRELIGGGR